MLAIPAPVLFLVSACIALFVLVRQGTLGQLGAGLQRVEPATIGMALLLTAIGLGLLAMRWWMLVRMAGGDVAPPVAADVFLTSVILNYAAPIGLAAPARAALSKRDLGLSVTGLGIFLLWPTAVPPPGVTWTDDSLFAFLKATDASGNACPSLHVAFAVFTAFVLGGVLRQLAAGRAAQALNWLWCAGILYSTLATRQHVALDVLAGTVLGATVALAHRRGAR